jgi:polyhydroxybutyrate depolymerase
VNRAALLSLAAVGLIALGACRRASSASPPADGGPASLVASRPYALSIPRAADGKTPLPLVLVMHGYGGSGKATAEGWGYFELGEREGFLVAAPDGTLDQRGSRFWNASDACCNFYGAEVDDVAYVRAILDDVAARTPLDKKRVFVVGHSNGGFFAHRLACDMPDRIAAVVSHAGAAWKDGERCRPIEPVSVVQVHGTADETVRPGGGLVFDRPGARYPSVAETISLWKDRLGCSGEPDRGVAQLDLDVRIPGAETRVDRFVGCRAALELWTIDHGAHSPAFGRAWAEAVWAFFKAHPKGAP